MLFMISSGWALRSTLTMATVEVDRSALTHLSPCCSRPLLLCGGAVPSGVHLKAHKTFSAILWPPAGCCGKTPELPGQRLSALATVWADTTLFCLNILSAGYNDGLVYFTFGYYYLAIILPLAIIKMTQLGVYSAKLHYQFKEWY